MVTPTNPKMCFLQAEAPSDFAAIEASLSPKCLLLAADTDSDYPQTVENLRTDDGLTIADKLGLAEALAKSGAPDAAGLWGTAIEHCRSRQRRGPTIADQDSRSFGHVMTRQRLADRLASVSDPTSPHTFTNRPTDPAIDAILGATLATQKFDLEDLMLSAYQMWSFHQPADPLNPYAGVDCRGPELRRRLGLGFYPEDAEFLHCGIHLGVDPSAHQPTAFDAELNRWFRPGGHTYPLDGASDGLPEVVHKPVAGDRLNRPIRPAQR